MDEVLALIDGVSAGMPLGPTLSLSEPRLTITIVGSDGSPPSPEASWSSLPAVRPEDLPRSAVAAIARTVAEHTGAAPWPARRPAWFRSGWLDAVDAWIDTQLAALGLIRAGPCSPVRVWSLSAVLRVPICDDRSVWFKATCDHFRDEPAITRALGRFVGWAVPRVLAMDERNSWMLLAPLPETDTDDTRRVAAVAAAMARIQVEAIAHVDELRAAGCPDRGLRATLDAFGHLVHHSVELERLAPARREAAVAIVPWVKRRLEDFFGCGIAESLVHGDLHLGNVAGGDRPVIFDWTDACISHPFLDGAHLVRAANDRRAAAVKRGYTAPWQCRGDHARAWDLAPFANRVFQAVTYEAIYRAQEDASRWEMAGVVARTLEELTDLHRASRPTRR